MVYSQSGTLYDLIPHAPRPTTDLSRPITEPPDGILGSVQTQMEDKSSKKQTQNATPTSEPEPPSKTTSSLVSSTEVNAVQSTKSSSEKKKGKNKLKKLYNWKVTNHRTLILILKKK